MPDHSTIFVYGALDAKGVSADATSLIFKNKSIKGYWLANELNNASLFKMIRYVSYVSKNINSILKTNIRATYGLQQID